MNEKETTKKLNACIQNLNAVLQECRKQNIGVAIGVEYPEKSINDTIYCHKDNNYLYDNI